MKILMADDDDNFRTLLGEVLAEAGYEVAAAENGRQAWELLEAEGADLAVLDVNMPELDGFGLLARVRDDARFAGLPVLMMTVRAATPDQVSGYDAGADDYLPKPFANEVLLARVKVLERRILNNSAEEDPA